MAHGGLKIFYSLFICTLLLSVGNDSKRYYHFKPQILFEQNLFQEGDLVFRKGKGFFTNFFSSAGRMKTSFSHVGIIQIRENRVYVIHTEASELTGIGFAKIEPIEVFLNDDNAFFGSLYRLNDKPETYGKAAVRNAAGFVKARVPFDTAFDLGTQDRLYCTELVWLAYKKVGIDLVKEMDILRPPVIEKTIVSIGSILNGGKLILVKKLKEDDI